MASEANCVGKEMNDALQGTCWRKRHLQVSTTGHSEDEVSYGVKHFVKEGPVWDISWAL